MRRNFAQYIVAPLVRTAFASVVAGRGKSPPTSAVLPFVSALSFAPLICAIFTTPGAAGAAAFLYFHPLVASPVQQGSPAQAAPPGIVKLSVLAFTVTVSVAPLIVGSIPAGVTMGSFDWNWNLVAGFTWSLLPTMPTAGKIGRAHV